MSVSVCMHVYMYVSMYVCMYLIPSLYHISSRNGRRGDDHLVRDDLPIADAGGHLPRGQSAHGLVLGAIHQQSAPLQASARARYIYIVISSLPYI